MKTLNDYKIIGIDHGYGNMKTANCCFPTGVIVSDIEPPFTNDLLIWNNKYYSIGVGHKKFTAAKAYTAEIFRKLREHDYNPKLMKLYVVGGGGCLIRHFGEHDKNRVFISSDICATAKGYEYIAYTKLCKNGGAA